MKKNIIISYRVSCEGIFCEVWAHSAEEAKILFVQQLGPFISDEPTIVVDSSVVFK